MSRVSLRVCLLAVSFSSAAAFGCVLYVEDTQCGPNAYDYRGACYCEDGYDGDHPRDEGCSPVMTFRITDACDDGHDIEWKLFSDDRDWTWPTGAAVYTTRGLDYDSYESILCDEGELICFGAESGTGLVWGVGLDYSAACDDCCFVCGSYEQDLGLLYCN